MNTGSHLGRTPPIRSRQGTNQRSGQGSRANADPVPGRAVAHAANVPFVHATAPNAALAAGLLSQVSANRGADRINDLRMANQADMDRMLSTPGFDVNAPTAGGTTLLMLTVEQNYMPAMQTLLARPELDVNARNQQGNTALHLSVLTGRVNELDALLGDARVDTNLINVAGNTALCLAAKNDCDEAVEHLINYQLVHHKMPEQPAAEYLKALRMAANYNAFRAITVLLHFMPWLRNTTRSDGHTALTAAIKAGRLDVVEMLLTKYPDLDVNLAGEGLKTALDVAATQRNTEMVLTLLRHPGLDPNAHLDGIGTTVLHLAASRGDANIVQALMSAWPVIDVNAKTQYLETPLHKAAHLGNLETLRVLAPRVDNINQKGWDGWSALHYAAAAGNVEAVRFLSQRQGTEPVPVSIGGRTPADIAEQFGYPDLARLLRESGPGRVAHAIPR